MTDDNRHQNLTRYQQNEKLPGADILLSCTEAGFGLKVKAKIKATDSILPFRHSLNKTWKVQLAARVITLQRFNQIRHCGAKGYGNTCFPGIRHNFSAQEVDFRRPPIFYIRAH